MNRVKNLINRMRTFDDWYKLVFPFNRLFVRGTSLHLRAWGNIWVRNVFSDDVTVFINLFTLDEYKIKNIQFPSTPTVLDIGANIGAFSILIKKYFPTAHIVAFEPNPANFSLLKQNAPFVQAIQKAIASESKTVRFSTTGSHTSTRISAEGDISVDALAFKELLREYPTINLLKIDIEGAEYELFHSINGSDVQRVEKIIMELHGDNEEQRKGILHKIQNSGFSISWINPDLFVASHKI